jgi:hypothetical protein
VVLVFLKATYADEVLVEGKTEKQMVKIV